MRLKQHNVRVSCIPTALPIHYLSFLLAGQCGSGEDDLMQSFSAGEECKSWSVCILDSLLVYVHSLQHLFSMMDCRRRSPEWRQRRLLPSSSALHERTAFRRVSIPCLHVVPYARYPLFATDQQSSDDDGYERPKRVAPSPPVQQCLLLFSQTTGV